MTNHSAFSPCLARARRKIEPLLNNERFEEKTTEDKNKQIKTKDGFNFNFQCIFKMYRLLEPCVCLPSLRFKFILMLVCFYCCAQSLNACINQRF